jgi:hypothetical protein
VLTQFDLGWIVAFLEGEGHFRFHRNSKRGGGTPLVTADQLQRWPLDILVHLVGGKIYWYPKQGRGIHIWQLRGQPAVALMMTVYVKMSPRRKAQIADAIAVWRTIRPWGHITHCKRGHAYTPENTMLWADGYKRCRACDQLLRNRKHLRSVD